MSKPGYSTYVADRLSGFAGHEPAKPRLDTREHPNFVAAYERMTGANVARRAVCVGPIAVRDREPLHQDIANLRDALDQVGRRRVHDRGLARSRSGVPDQPLLSLARGLCRSDRRGDAGGIRGDRQGRALCCSSIAPIWRWRATPASRI